MFKDAVAVGYTGVGRPSMAPFHNRGVGGHRDRTSDGCFLKQEKREAENGIIPREPSVCRPMGSSTQCHGPSHQNGFLSARDEKPESEKDKDDSMTPPRKKRGRRKLERPTKCELKVEEVTDKNTTAYTNTYEQCTVYEQ